MSSYHSKPIGYSSTVFSAGPNIDLKELEIQEDWCGRPASSWAVRRIGLLQAKVEQFSYKIYHSSRYGKHHLSRLIPGYVLRQMANEAFGFDGWKMQVLHVEAHEKQSSSAGASVGDEGFKCSVLAEAEVEISLEDGTNTRAGGFGCATLSSKGESYAKAKKEAVNDAFKKALLSFEKIILEHGIKVENNYYVGGVYASDMEKHVQVDNVHQ
ncbi:hypothetical protein HG536_0E01590 [Torulaspora globosa]|uniref:DNA repair protein RAD59 n=1 Tax=Torulaspora globosa TaxID=48254 RepID=A0A7G3ZIB2_9SACH|nr:uncharacterized protein HG536_0E01590 [Torulaspora globosa]QLL33248.1 hypothetical protein HG536_0E01590 [Torulaspora globosa]